MALNPCCSGRWQSSTDMLPSLRHCVFLAVRSNEEVEQETLDLVEGMPEVVEVVIKASEIPADGDAEDYIIKKACDTTGLPIKGATVLDAWEKDTESIEQIA